MNDDPKERLTGNRDHIEVAKALVQSFVTGDVEVARKRLTSGYVQHDLAFGTGRDSFISAVNGLQLARVQTTVQTVRAFQDGHYVVLHNLYNFAGAGEQVGFDVFRFEQDQIAEHWDNLADLAPANPSGHTQLDGPTSITDEGQTAANKRVVANFVRDVLQGAERSATAKYFDGDHYLQHNIKIADGLSGLQVGMAERSKEGITTKYDQTHFVLGEGNFVLAASEGQFNGNPVAFYDLFRLANDYIAEHWDIVQGIPPKTAWKNQNGKF